MPGNLRVAGIAMAMLLGSVEAGGKYASQADAAEGACVQGTWKVLTVGGAEPLQYQSEHFAMHWSGSLVSQSDASTAGTKLEEVWDTYLGKTKFPVPYCDTATKYKVHVEIKANNGLTGGPINDRDMGFWIGPGALKDTWGLSHEFAHALQGSTRGFRDSPYVGWMWESHANWMAHQLDEHRSNVHCSEMLVNNPHLYYGSARDFYCNWQFFEYIKNAFGYATVQNIWTRSLKQSDSGVMQEDPFKSLMRGTGWSVTQLNDQFGLWAMRNVNWDYKDPDGTETGPYYRSSYGSYDDRSGERAYRVTQLVPVNQAKRIFKVPFYWAPQRWGYNLVKLIPDSGASSITVSFKGGVQSRSAVSSLGGLNNEPSTIVSPNSDWRWGVVAIESSGASRYSALQSGASATVNFALKSGDRAVYMVVVGTPSVHQQILVGQAYYSIYRYPWSVQLTNAMPQGFESNAQPLFSGVSKHSNGGGWVSSRASVASTAYVGPYAYVLSGSVSGSARIEDHAIVDNGAVSGSARLGALTRIIGGTTVRDNSDLATTFRAIGAFETGITLSGTAKLRGDVEERGASLSRGVFTGFVGTDAANDARQGASLSQPVAEVTSEADFSSLWAAGTPPAPSTPATPTPPSSTPPSSTPPSAPPPPPSGSGSLANGVYRIVSKLSGKVLDVAGGSTADGANVLQYTYRSVANQHWQVTSLGGGYYSIINAQSGKALDVSGASRDNGGNVLQWTWKQGTNQQWSFQAAGAYFGVINRNSGKALDVWESGMGDNVNVAQYTYSGGNQQLWSFVSASSVSPPTSPAAPPATLAPVRAPAACSSPAALWGDCLNNHCCTSGNVCYEANQWYAQCRPSCAVSGWTCKVLA